LSHSSKDGEYSKISELGDIGGTEIIRL